MIIDLRLPYDGFETDGSVIKIPFASRESAEIAVHDMQVYVKQENPVVTGDIVTGEIER
jgi:hypothetical protein